MVVVVRIRLRTHASCRRLQRTAAGQAGSHLVVWGGFGHQVGAVAATDGSPAPAPRVSCLPETLKRDLWPRRVPGSGQDRVGLGKHGVVGALRDALPCRGAASELAAAAGQAS